MAGKGNQSKAGGIFVDFRLGLANLQKSTKEATKVLKGLEKDIQGIGKNITRAFQLAGSVGGVLAVSKLTQGLKDLAKEGDRTASIQENFKKLGGAATEIDKAQKATLGLVSSFDLMQVANKGLIANVEGFGENFGKLSEFSTRLADSMGGDVKQSLEEVTQAFITGKEKGLEALGFNIQADKAYKEFAKTNGLVADKLDITQKKLAIQAQAFSQLDEVNGRLAPATAGVGDAFDRVSVALSDAFAKTGQAIDQNEQLKRIIEELAIALETTDWEDIGRQLGNMAAFIADVVRGLAEMAALIKEIGLIATKLNPTLGASLKNNEYLLAEAKRQAAEAEYAKFGGAGRGALLGSEPPEKQIADTSGEFKKLQDEIKKSTEEFKKLEDEIISSGLEKGLNDAIKYQGAESFNKLADQLYDRVYESTYSGLKKAVDAGKVDLIEAQSLAAIKANEEVSKYRDDFAKVAADNATKIQEEHKKAYENSIDTWRSLFENAITGVTFDLESALKQVAVGFAAEMAQAAFGSIGGLNISSPQDLGGSIAKSVLGDLTGGIGSIFGSATQGIGPVADGAEYAGMLAGESMVSTLTSAMPAVGAALGAAAVVSFGKSVLDSPKQPYEQYGRDSPVNMAGRGLAAVSTFGASELALYAMSGGSNNAETNARKALAGAIEDLIKEIGGLNLYKDGKLERITDIKVGSDNRFDQAGWADQFNAQQSSSVFNALGQGLQGILGITEDVGGQMAMILSENFGGSVDNARAAVQQLGLSFEDFEKYFFQLAEKGEIRWSEFNVHLAGISEAFKPGLEAIGATKQAFEQLVASGGRGLNAVIQLKNLAQEGLDLNLENIQQLGQKLIADGFDPEQVNALIQSASERGLAGLKQIAEGTNQQVGSIVGGMESLSSSLTETWSEMFAKIDELNGKFENFPSEVVTKFKVESEIDPDLLKLIDAGGLSGGSIPTLQTGNVEKFSNGGIVSRPTLFNNAGNLAMAGESGLEAILPLTRRNGKLGVSFSGKSATGSSYVINVDARGAQAGVSQEVVAAVRRMKSEIIGDTMEKIANYTRRGRM